MISASPLADTTPLSGLPSGLDLAPMGPVPLGTAMVAGLAAVGPKGLGIASISSSLGSPATETNVTFESRGSATTLPTVPHPGK